MPYDDTLINRAMTDLRRRAEGWHVTELAKVVLDYPGFNWWSAASKANTHHYGRGGLVVHTHEVVSIADCTAQLYNSYLVLERPLVCNRRDLFLAALFHDVGKIFDYKLKDEAKDEWGPAEHKYLIHHISRSAQIWLDAAKEHKYEGDIEGIWHAILAHHGQKEWGSPVEPRTRLAHILHCSDMISARVEDCDTLHTRK
jgi:3'-5' exoribonuclease